GAVAVYVDDAVQPHRLVTTSQLPLWDVEQIEVFRGPQSTSQGRTALAGAVIIRTRDPQFTPELLVQANVGNHGQRGASFVGGGTLVENTVAGRLAVDYQEADGYQHNRTLGNHANPNRDLNLRGKLRLQPNDQLDI